MSSTKHIELHEKSKPTFTIACTIIIVLIYEIPNRTLQVMNPIKTNTPAETGYLTEELSLDI